MQVPLYDNNMINSENSDDYPYVQGRVPKLPTAHWTTSPLGNQPEPVFDFNKTTQRSESLPEAQPEYHVLEKPEYHVLERSLSDPHKIYDSQDTEETYEELEMESEYQEIEINTVADWLNVLSLSCYEDVFKFNGWSNIMMLQKMRMSDLDSMGITNPNDRAMIIAAIQDLKQC